MGKILILGAYGQIARLTEPRLLKETNDDLTLYLRNSDRLFLSNSKRESIVDGDVNDTNKLVSAMKGQNIVIADLSSPFEPLAKSIITAMQKTGVRRLIYITGLGLYHEVPGEFGRWVEASCGKDIMDDTRRAAKIIEDSKVNYTIIRAAYMSNKDEINYETTQKGTPFKGTTISRKSIADYIMKLIKNPDLDNRASVGIDKPGTDGPRPIY